MNRTFIRNSTLLSIMVVLAVAAPTVVSAQTSVQKAPVARMETPAPDSDLRILLASVQVVLDRAGFRPGKIDGLGGEFTQKAADRLNQSRGLPPGTLVDISGLSSPYRSYEVTEEDLAWIGKTASSPPEQQKLKRMPYADAWEMLAEMFHCDLDFLRELNPSLAGVPITAGTLVRVVDVEPFRMADVVALEKSRREAAKASATPAPSATPSPVDLQSGITAPAPAATLEPMLTTSTPTDLALSPQPTPESFLTSPVEPVVIPPTPTPEPPKRHIVLLTGPRILELYEDDRLIASYPCTPGSGRVPVPVGEWRITANILMPYFRYDKSVLKDGTRSDNAFNIPPGPNNYVGIVWMAINRPSVGIHGTQSPDQIGRNESSGCIRLANWDAFDLSQKISKGTPVIVRREEESAL